ncbi:LemA family protein [Francisella adeliensis]|uniref:LemA family protein n=1 Tax=Francisella adeliensis TaxID=2007306 RepID=A0A2Z4Y1P7_9GAMM|nr:LemA family protein [Francisella adeliensis]AXA34425.1 LemA family protein [Francisella adeliensis]MBK2086517.1 LemA family protein [Francisella adeliensis]MBK2096145.1 LemA family protein [Francisella adeliensis]QIW12671.1 LemA family protein [Francisella adeliensis]QIW14546.1 LemA family protein [Francisella adeliensis]
MSIGIILLIIVVIIGAYIVMTYNKLISEIETTKNSQKQIDVQLDRRSKVFDSLINVVKKYMDYEQTTLKQVVELRSQANQAQADGDEKTRITAENKISQFAKGINVQFENYPELKANQNVIQLQEEITSTENKLAYAKQAFNDSIERYNAHKKSFFAGIVVNIFKKLDENFVYWNLSEEKIQQLEESRVEL